MSITPKSPAINQQGWVQTWVTSRWKNPSIPGQFSAEINIPHTFRVVGDRPGRLLAIAVPAGFEHFFVEASERDLRIPDHMPAVTELAERYGLQFIGPADWGH